MVSEGGVAGCRRTLPTAASPSRTSLTLLLGLAVFAFASAMGAKVGWVVGGGEGDRLAVVFLMRRCGQSSRVYFSSSIKSGTLSQSTGQMC